MERESFENEDIGRLLSDNFVPIKVDREERPDVDKVYVRDDLSQHYSVLRCPPDGCFVQQTWWIRTACLYQWC